MSDDEGVADRRGVVRVAEKISETPPRADNKKEERRLDLIDKNRRRREKIKQQLEERVRLQAVVIPALEGRIVGLETSEAALQSLLTAKV
jgi:hypothetical protein